MSPTKKHSLIDEQYSQSKVYAQQLLDIYRLKDMSVRLLNKGACMRPIIEKGDYLEVLPNVQNYRAGDIVVLRIQGELVVHRIVDISRQIGDERFITKGDMMLRCDRPIGRNEIYGKVVAISKVNSGRKIDCMRLTRLFSTIARFSFRCAKFNKFICSSCGQDSILHRMTLQFMRIWTKLFYILIKIGMELHNL